MIEKKTPNCELAGFNEEEGGKIGTRHWMSKALKLVHFKEALLKRRLERKRVLKKKRGKGGSAGKNQAVRLLPRIEVGGGVPDRIKGNMD